MGMDLFDDSGDDDVENLSKISIDKEFAKRYEHNKKREDLQRFEELKKKGLVDDDSDSESESESDDVDDEDDDVNELLDGLLKIRNKDPILMEKDAKLFESDDDNDNDDDNDDEEKKEKKKKPKYLKDVNAQHLLEEGPECDDDDEKEGEKMVRVKSYAEEQEDLRRAVLDAMAEAEKDDDDDGDLFKFKENEKEKSHLDDDVDVGNEEFEKKLDAYFGEEDENERFLKEFLRNKMWIDKDKGKRVVEDADLDGISDDEEALEKQEDYEREYNFRFEEGVSDRVLGHSRVVEGSVRKESNARKQQRERKKERLAQAEIERREEVKRLKNLKKREIQERLDRIREIAGVGGDNIPLTEEDLEEDFDPEEFDKKMKAAFGDEYYEAKDVDPGFGSDEDESDLEKPDFEKEDELLGLPKDWDVIKSDDGFVAEREKRLKSKVDSDEGDNNDGDSDEEDSNEVGDDDDENGDQLEGQEGKKKRKRKLSLKEKVALDKELEELYKLDYEDAIGDLKTRFKYREVAPRKYGLSAAHILWCDDKELNQYVSLKKLAPYREKEYTVPRMQRRSFMLKRGALLEAAMNRQMGRKKRRRTELGESSNSGRRGPGPHEDEKAQAEQPSNDESKLSRAAKRRRRQKEKKLPQSRLAAYGKIPYSSKKKSKS